LSVASSSTQNSLTIGGTASVLTGLGLTANDYQGVASTSAPNATRTSLESDYNNVLSQIDSLAKDASYNGVNLLNGDDLKVVFNETGSSSQTISGVTFDTAGLGLSSITGTGFQSDANIDTAIADLDTALSSLRTQASKFGSNLTTVQTRQDFTKNMINTLQTGADNLVLADTNEEGANLLALQTRQQLSTTALSLSAQADQAVLRLF
jgi:flagellin-like hook-associated protein FlgL